MLTTKQIKRYDVRNIGTVLPKPESNGKVKTKSIVKEIEEQKVYSSTPPFPKYKRVKRIAPDARIRINQSFEVRYCPNCPCTTTADVNLMSFTTNLNINSVPGTASLTFVVDKNQRHRYFIGDETIFKEMDEIEILVKSNFTEGDNLPQYDKYYTVFKGIITGIGVDESAGVLTISIDCADILRLWELTRLNLHPGVDTLFYTTNKQDILNRMNIALKQDIFQFLVTLMSYQFIDWIVPANLVNTVYGIGINEPIETKRLFHEWQSYWRKRLTKTANMLLILDYQGGAINIQAGKQINLSEFQKQGLISFGDFGITDDFRPLIQEALQGGISLQSEFKTYLEIANQLKEYLHWEFYMDSTGDLVFKPPFYNLDTRPCKIYNIDDIDIVSKSLGWNESQVITSVNVRGSIHELLAGGSEQPEALYIDYNLTKRYGLRQMIDYDIPYIRNKDLAFGYAIMELDRLNTLRREGSITIIGRPELRLGFPIYVKSLDTFYYITGISHNFTFGGTYTTTISYIGARSKYKPLTNVPVRINGVYKNVYLEWEKYPTELETTKELESKILPDAQSERNLNASESQGYFITTKTKEAKIKPKKTQDFRNKLLENSPNIIDVEFYRNKKQIEEEKSKATENTAKSIKIGEWVEKQSNIKVWDLMTGNYLENLKTLKPVSDEEGYEIVGSFPYGNLNYIDEEGKILRKSSLTITNKIQKASLKASNMTPTKGNKLSKTETGDKRHIRTKDLREAFSIVGRSYKASEMRPQVETLNTICDCDCHKVNYREGRNLRIAEDKINLNTNLA